MELPKTNEPAKCKKRGTPNNQNALKPINEKQVIACANIMCTMEEIASVVGCSVDTLERRFAGVIKEAREGGKQSLRRLQWQSAQAGSVPMQQWLGKQWLGQRDKQPDEAQQVIYNVKITETP